MPLQKDFQLRIGTSQHYFIFLCGENIFFHKEEKLCVDRFFIKNNKVCLKKTERRKAYESITSPRREIKTKQVESGTIHSRHLSQR